jgi:hypothetical protein
MIAMGRMKTMGCAAALAALLASAAAGQNDVEALREAKARAAAAVECPEAADLWLRDMRKRAGQLTPSLEHARQLYQHSSLSTTRQHYVQGERVKPAR